MSDLPPPGPPPPKVPEGWKAVWNDQYSEYFFVNLYTKKSQWDKPTEPVYPSGEAAPDGPPPYLPSTTGGTSTTSTATDQKRLSSNNPYAGSDKRPSHDLSEDERLARRLQEEENARAHGGVPGSADDRGLADAFYKQQQDQGGYGSGYPPSNSPYPPQNQSPYPPSQPPYGQQNLGPQEAYADKGKSKSGGFLGKLLGKSSSKPGYGQPAYGQPQGYPQQGYGGYGGAPGGYYGGPQQQYYAQQPGKKKHGLGAGGAAALGVGGGLLGGALLGEALADAGDGGDYGGDGGDYGGDGGDFGGDGGDFGGGDF